MGLFGSNKKKKPDHEPQEQFQAPAPAPPTSAPPAPPRTPPKSPVQMQQPLTVEMGASEDAEVVGWTSQDPERVRAQIAASMAAKGAASSPSKSVSSRSGAVAAASRANNLQSQSSPPARSSAGAQNSQSNSASSPVRTSAPSLNSLANAKTPRTSSRPSVPDVTSSVTYESPTSARLNASSSAFLSVGHSTDVETADDNFAYRGGVMTQSGTFESTASGAGTYYSEDESLATANITRDQNEMTNPEPLVMANLMQWKAAAEDGPLCLRFLVVLAAFAILVTSLIPFILDPDFLTFRHGILAAYTFIFSIIIIIMDGRVSSLGRNPVGCRAKLRKLITKHFNVMRLMWGRGLLAMFTGSLHIAQMLPMTIISGGIVAGLGLIAWLLGCMASYNLSNLKASLTDDSFLEYLFDKHDKDGDGYINAYEFSLFLVDIGLEFDDVYTLKAFSGIPKKRDRRVSFREFHKWWSQCKVDNSDERQNRSRVVI